MNRAFPGTMDDTGFTVSRSGAVQAAPVPAPWPRPASRPQRRLNRAWAWGVGAAAVLHAAMLGPLMLAEGPSAPRFTPPPVAMYLDLTPPPAPRVEDLKTPAPAEPLPAPSRPVEQKPLPFTPREARSDIAPPARIEPLPVAPRPVPAPSPVEAAPAAPEAPAAASAPSSTPSPAFQRQVLAALERVRRYPPAARAKREEGVAIISFSMNRAGRVLDASVQTSSGSKTLDRAALETVRRASLPRVPAEFGDPLRLTVPVEYALN